MSKIIMGYWDCQYCGAKGNRGDARECPACGHPRDESVKFYMKDTTYVSDEKAATINKNPDWYCSYCNTLNSDDDSVCKSCGANRADSEFNYYELRKKEQEKKEKADEERRTRTASQSVPAYKGKSKIGIGILIAAIALLTIFFLPKKTKVTVDELSWARTIHIEQYMNVDESDWSLPEGANLHETRSEIHHYDHVIDHYETVAVQKSEQVLDGYDTHTNYVDMGNGYFEEQTYETPRYTTRYYTDYEEQPVYRDDPVYATKYYYDIWKWCPTRSVDTEGLGHTAYWGDTNLADDERESFRDEYYNLIVVNKKGKQFAYLVDEDIWDSLNVGDKLTIKMYRAGNDELLDNDGNVIATLYD